MKTLHRNNHAYLVEMTAEEQALLDALIWHTKEGTRRAAFTRGLLALVEVYAKQIPDKKKVKELRDLASHAENSRTWSNTRTRWRTGNLGL
jgi:hypothetical protein